MIWVAEMFTTASLQASKTSTTGVQRRRQESAGETDAERRAG